MVQHQPNVQDNMWLRMILAHQEPMEVSLLSRRDDPADFSQRATGLLSPVPNVAQRRLAPLDFWPPILRWYSVLFLVVLYFGTAVSIVALWLTAGTNGQYHLSSENVRMISRYFPSALGTLNVILFRQFVREYIRMKPFVVMADQWERVVPGGQPSKCVSGAFFPWQDIMVSRGLTTIISLLCQIMVSFIVSLKVALLASGTVEVKTSGNQQTLDWTLTLRVWPAFFLIIGHIIMGTYVLWIAYLYRSKSTGLRWDPVTIADYCALFSKCNVAKYFSALELLHNRKARNVMATEQLFRLGYWDQSQPNGTTKLVYGIGATWTAEVHFSSGMGNTADTHPGHHVAPASQSYNPSWWDKWTGKESAPSPVNDCGNYRHQTQDGQGSQSTIVRPPPPCKQGTWPSCEHYPYKHSPGCGKGYTILAWLLTIAALGVAIFGLVNGIVFRGFHLQKHWSMFSNVNITEGRHTFSLPPLDPTDPQSKLVVYALVFRSAPVYVAGLFTATIIEWIDLNARFMQPFINMFGEAGNAADTILLAYITTSPLQVPITALAKGHYRVAVFSTLNTLSPLFPIFIGGLLTLTDGGHQVFFTFSLSAYIGVMTFLIAWTLALPFAYPFQKRLLPRQFYSMADLIAMCHKSFFLQRPYLDCADKDRTPTKEIMEARILLSGDRFLFGHYTDDNDCRHVGFDVHSFVDPETERTKYTHLVQPVTPAGELPALISGTRRMTTNLFGGEDTRRASGTIVKSNTFITWLRGLVHTGRQRAPTATEMRPMGSATGSHLEAGQRDAARQRTSVAFAPVDELAS